MAGPSGNEKKWLIKSSGVVQGPFSFDEVVQSLKDRKIAMIDEVRSPEGRWLFIRESKAFAEVVKTLRASEDDSKEETFIGSKTVTHLPEDDLTAAPIRLQPLQRTAPEPETKSDPEIQSTSSEANADQPKLASYASSQDPRVKRKVRPRQKKSSLWLWVLILIGLLAFALFQVFNSKTSVRNLGYDDFVKLARESKQIGQLERALEFYRKAESLRGLDPMSQLQMAPLLMQVENQNVQARQILEGLKTEGKITGASLKSLESLIALSFLREGRLDEAFKRYSDVVQTDPSNEFAQINLVEISILQGRFDRATEQINKLMKAGVKDQALFLFRILAIYRTVDDPQKLEGAKADLRRLQSQSQDYQAEMLLLEAAIERKLGQEAEVAETIQAILRTDPDLTRKHLHEFLIHREVLEWGYLGNICDILAHEASHSAVFQGLSAYCSYEQADLKAALDKIEKGRTQFANDVNLVGLHAFLLYRSGRTSEAKAVIQLPNAKNSELALSVKAYLCQDQKDWTCVEETWEQIQSKNSQNLAAYAGITRAAFESGHREMAEDTLKRGLLISNHYKPFLEMKELLSDD